MTAPWSGTLRTTSLRMQGTNNTLKPEAVKYIAIHCTDTPPDMDVDVQEVGRWHRKRGFIKVGYHYLIRRSGEVQHGRSVNEIGFHMFEEGAHVFRYNRTSIGICLVGGRAKGKKVVPENNFLPAQFNALATLLHQLKSWFPDAIIQGHCDFPVIGKEGKKTCPNFNVKDWLKTRTDI